MPYIGRKWIWEDSPARIETFAGIDLSGRPDQVSGAIDGLNFDLTAAGALRPRRGREYDSQNVGGQIGPQIAANTYWDIQYPRILAAIGTSVKVLDSGGTVKATSAFAITAGTRLIVPGGGLGAIVTEAPATDTGARQYFIVNDDQLTGVLHYVQHNADGTAAIVTPAVTDPSDAIATAWAAAATPWDARLALAWGRGRVSFSKPGDPTDFSTAAGHGGYVDIEPGDGDWSRALVRHGPYLFYFKENRCWVFYGVTTAADGTPTFNYRLLSDRVGSVIRGGVAVAPEGVYFLDRSGAIYFTAGGVPQVVSFLPQIGAAIATNTEDADTASFYQGPTLDPATVNYNNAQLVYARNRLFLFTGGSGSACLVYNLRYGFWSAFQFQAGETFCGAAPFLHARFQDEKLLIASQRASGEYDFHRWPRDDMGFADDTGNPTVRYRTSFADYGGDAPKTIREVKLWGSGTVTVKHSTDYGALSAGRSIALTTGTPKHYRTAHRGMNVSYEFSSSSGAAWLLDRVIPMIRDQRMEELNV